MASQKREISINFGGWGIGFWVAAVLSYMKWGGFWLAFGHAILGWIYVIYYLLRYTAIRHFLGL
jgi:hypothetical protein